VLSGSSALSGLRVLDATQDKRYQNRPKLAAELATIFKTRRSAEWLDTMLTHEVPAGPIYRIDEMFEDAQVQHLRWPRRSRILNSVTLRSLRSLSTCRARRHG
jgi:crotonobetainyl-CoA:carnitine CoA-transferase CaiB-like acyl-CoA transferase